MLMEACTRHLLDKLPEFVVLKTSVVLHTLIEVLLGKEDNPVI